MPKFVKVATVDEVQPGTGKLVRAHDKPIALFNVDGTLYAVNQVCPHEGGPLAEGAVNGTVVTCPWHGWTFDVRTGEPDHPGGHAVSAYEVRLEGQDILIGWLKRRPCCADS